MNLEEAPSLSSHSWLLLDIPIQDEAQWLTVHFRVNIKFILMTVVFGRHDKASLGFFFFYDQFQKCWGKISILSVEFLIVYNFLASNNNFLKKTIYQLPFKL